MEDLEGLSPGLKVHYETNKAWHCAVMKTHTRSVGRNQEIAMVTWAKTFSRERDIFLLTQSGHVLLFFTNRRMKTGKIQMCSVTE